MVPISIDWLHWRARNTPERTALISEGVSWSFAELNSRAMRIARCLGRFVKPGDRASILLSNGPEFVEILHGVSKIGCVLVPLNTRLAVPELLRQIDDAEVSLLVYDEPNAPKAASIAKERPALPCVRTSGSASDDPFLENLFEADVALKETINPEAVHSIFYTSGTTGRPKGVQLTYGNHAWSAISSALNLGLYPNDRWLSPLPLFHVGGFAVLIRSLIYGIPALIHRRFDPAAVNRAIDEEGVTIVSVVNVILARMLEEREGKPYPPNLRCVLAGGGPIPRELLKDAAELKIPVVQTYGLTETASQVATLSPKEAGSRLGSAGRPLFGTEVRIEKDGQEQPPGKLGEILVKGPTVMKGYFRNNLATARVLREGWLHTGDVGYFDREGYLYVLDRREDLIISGGENIYPAEVEAVLMEHPAILEAGVTGTSHPIWGQAVVAAVCPHPNVHLSEEEVLEFCRNRLAHYKVPTKVKFVKRLPKNASGKLIRRVIAEGWES